MYKLTLCQTYLGRKKRGFSKPVAGRLVKIRAFFTSPLTHGSQSGRRPRVSGSVRAAEAAVAPQRGVAPEAVLLLLRSARSRA